LPDTRDIALVVALIALSAVAARWGWLAARRRVSAWWTWRRSQRGERRAEKLLKRHGYKILKRQARCVYQIYVDDVAVDIELRADLLVRNTEGVFVAEVKTGRSAPRVRNAATRRQLLEYAVAYDTLGVLLVDMEREEIAEVRFPL
jgi:Holliday junction resolvase-like predicted endonuclease